MKLVGAGTLDIYGASVKGSYGSELLIVYLIVNEQNAPGKCISKWIVQKRDADIIV